MAYDGTPVMLPNGFRPVDLPDGSQAVVDSDGNHDMLMPKNGFFFDVARHPLKDVQKASDLNKFTIHIENFDRSSWADLTWEKLAEYAKELKENEEKFLVGTF